jgi:hypothetical protein
MTPADEWAELRKAIALVLDEAWAEGLNEQQLSEERHTDSILKLIEAARQSEGGWQPIETAPRDGTEVIAYSQDVRGNSGLNPFVSLCAWHPDAGFCTCELRDATHWMPLPPAPHQATSTEGGK